MPDELHRRVRAIARDTSRTVSETVAELVRRGLGESAPSRLKRSARTGLPVIHVGRVIATEDVRGLEDEG